MPEAIIDLHRTRPDLVACGPALAVDGDEVLRRAGVTAGQPFVLGPDGSYDLHLNQFFRELPSWGVRAENSIAAYTRDVMLFCRFLHEGRDGKSIWQCDSTDLRTYKQLRLRTEGPTQVSLSTWRRSIAALDKWVRWSLAEGLLASEPFRYVDKTVMTPQGLKWVRVNSEQEPDSEKPPIRFVSFEDYLLWRNVGLRGELPNGRPDPYWRGRHGERNALFADVLIYTGMRLGEASSLLVPELPPREGGRVPGEIVLSSAVTKRRKARSVFLNARTVRSVYQYLAIERDELVRRCQAQGAYVDMADALSVTEVGRRGLGLVAGDGRSPYSKIGPASRQRLIHVDPTGQQAGPLWLWLGETGQPIKRESWQSIFRRANERCQRFDIPIEVHPHTLRHCFAVQMLGLLLRETLRALGAARIGDSPFNRSGDYW